MPGASVGFVGPLKHIKKYDCFVPKSGSEIETGTITIQGNTYDLLENKISFCTHDTEQKMMVYHSYTYIDSNNEKWWARWYDTEVPLEAIQHIEDRTFLYMMDSYEVETEEDGHTEWHHVPAYFTVTFTPTGFSRLLQLAENAQHPPSSNALEEVEVL